MQNKTKTATTMDRRLVLLVVMLVLAIGGITATLFHHNGLARAWLIRSRLRRLARAVLDALEAEDVPHWVDFGTLLGIVREDDIILGDNDVDICLLEEGPAAGDENEEAAAAAMDAKLERVADRLRVTLPDAYVVVRQWGGISRVYLPPPDHGPFQSAATAWCSPRLFCDLYHNRHDGDWYRGAEGPNSDIPAALVGAGTARWPWRQSSVRVPQDVEGALVWRYGADWRVPRPGYKGREGQA